MCHYRRGLIDLSIDSPSSNVCSKATSYKMNEKLLQTKRMKMDIYLQPVHQPVPASGQQEGQPQCSMQWDNLRRECRENNELCQRTELVIVIANSTFAFVEIVILSHLQERRSRCQRSNIWGEDEVDARRLLDVRLLSAVPSSKPSFFSPTQVPCKQDPLA